jgi:NAD(P)-dependent dehydrogenase (short-subunit alcohol dehydrogenase family)
MACCDGRVVIVTGAGRGLGRAHARAFAASGAHVLVNDLGTEGDGSQPGADDAATAVAEEINAAGGSAAVNHADVADWDQAGAMVAQAIDTWGRLDTLVCNAGFLRDRMLVNMSEQEWDAVVRVHLKGHFAPARHAVNHWRERQKTSGEAPAARIVNTSSGAGVVAAPGQPHYTAAKHGVVGLTKAAAQEYARRGIRVNAVLPGSTDTPMIRRFIGDNTEIAKMIAATNIGGRMLAPDEVAETAVWLASDAAGMVNGQSLIVDGGGLVR